MFMWELSTETNGIETAVVRYEVASIFATVEMKKRSWMLSYRWMLSAAMILV